MRKTRQNERGAVLLTTLLVMAIMAALAVALMDDIRLALKRTANISDYAQADWYVRGAEDYVAEVIAANLKDLDDAAMNQIVSSISPLILPIDGGVMQLNIRDGSHCFNLGSLTDAQGQVPNNSLTSKQFTDTLEALGLPPREIEIVKSRLLDWVDADTQTRPGGAEDGAYLRRTPQILPPNTHLASVMELRALEGMTPELFEALRPWVCMGEPYAANKFNINLAEPWHAPLLAGFMGGSENLSFALRLIEERPPQGYNGFDDVEQSAAFLDWQSSAGDDFDLSLFHDATILTKPESLWVELELSYRQAQRSRSFHFVDLDATPPRLVYRGWGRESFRPDIRPLDETDANANPRRVQ
jgi:general secretion pathway protein K